MVSILFYPIEEKDPERYASVMTEKEKMERGLVYDANRDKELLELRLRAEDLCFSLRNTSPREKEKIREILYSLIPDLGENTTILTPFEVDYGTYCHIGKGCFINHNAYLMDGGGIWVGDNTFIGPSCGLYTASHPLLPSERNRGLEKAGPIHIASDCWLGSSVVVLPGVTIGEGAVIGAGSVVTKDIPPYVIAVGNPARVLRKITEKDSFIKN